MTEDEASADDSLETFLSRRKDNIIDWIHENIRTQFVPTGQMFDRVANQVTREYPYGQGIDNMHRFSTNAIMCALWCGWFSEARHRANDPNFKAEYVERFQTIINSAYELGKRHASTRP